MTRYTVYSPGSPLEEFLLMLSFRTTSNGVLVQQKSRSILYLHTAPTYPWTKLSLLTPCLVGYRDTLLPAHVIRGVSWDKGASITVVDDTQVWVTCSYSLLLPSGSSLAWSSCILLPFNSGLFLDPLDLLIWWVWQNPVRDGQLWLQSHLMTYAKYSVFIKTQKNIKTYVSVGV